MKAEEIALSGKNESQDSQMILAAYQAQYGIGWVSAVVNRCGAVTSLQADPVACTMC
jgi:hypothetical protein